MIPTGVYDLDAFLGGGIAEGLVTDVWGPAGSGKTQLLMQVAAQAATAGYTVAYIDTAGDFRPRRILQMGCPAAALQNIGVSRAMSVHEQVSVLDDIPNDTGLLAVDGLTDLFSYEYAGKRAGFARNRHIMRYMRRLSSMALSRNIPVLVSNTVRYVSGRETESAAVVVGLHTHIKVYLSGQPRYTMWCRMVGRQRRFAYHIVDAGLRHSATGQTAMAGP